MGDRPGRRRAYIYKTDPNGPYVGFEVELAEYLATKLGRVSKPVEAEWSTLPELLEKSREGEKGIDIVLNGYEARDDLKGRRRDRAVLRVPSATGRPQGRRLGDRVGRPRAEEEAHRRAGGVGRVRLLQQAVSRPDDGPNKDVATMFNAVADNTHADVTVQDNPACIFYVDDPNVQGQVQAGRGRPSTRHLRHLPAEGRPQLSTSIDAAISRRG